MLCVQGTLRVCNHALELRKSIVPRLFMSQITLLGTAVKKSNVQGNILGPLSTQIEFVGVLGPYNSKKYRSMSDWVCRYCPKITISLTI